MPEDFIPSSTALKRLMDFMGKKAAAVDPKIPDTDGPAYSDHGTLNRTSDGMTLEQAIQALDIPWNLVTAKSSSTAWVNHFYTATRSQPLLVMGRVERKTEHSVDYNWRSEHVALNGQGNNYHEFSLTFRVTQLQTVVHWTNAVDTFQLSHDGAALDTVQILRPDGTASLMGIVTPTVASHTISLSNIGGELGELISTDIVVVGTHEF